MINTEKERFWEAEDLLQNTFMFSRILIGVYVAISV